MFDLFPKWVNAPRSIMEEMVKAKFQKKNIIPSGKLNLSKMLNKMMSDEGVSVRNLSYKSGVSPAIIQGLKSEKRVNVTLKNLNSILSVLKGELFAKKGNEVFKIGGSKLTT